MSTDTLQKLDAVAFFEAKLAYEIGPVELKMALEKGEKYQIVDLRTPEYYGKGRIPGSKNILIDNLETAGLDKDTTTIVYCYDVLCALSTKAALQLAKKGYKVRELSGGFDGWAQRKFQVEGKAEHGSCASSSCGG